MGAVFGRGVQVTVYFTKNPKYAPIILNVAEGSSIADVLETLHTRFERVIYDGPEDGDVRTEGTEAWRQTKITKKITIRIRTAKDAEDAVEKLKKLKQPTMDANEVE